MLKKLTNEEFENLPNDFKIFYTKAMIQNMGYTVIILSTEFRSMKSKYPQYFKQQEQ